MTDSPVDSMQATALANGLQEWAVCCRALLAGRLILVVRKGGIHERGGGLFQLEHQRFVLWPTYLHQDASRLTPDHAGVEFAESATPPQPGRVAIAGWAEAVRIWKVTELARVQALGGELLWTEAELAARFAYRDQPWLYVVALRVHRLPAPLSLVDHSAGCRSWIQLKQPIATAGSTAVVDDGVFARRLAAVASTLGAPS